jgi:hypothetical protein
MNYLKKFNEEVGFDDEETRDRLEIPNLRGELEPNSPDMRTFYYPTDKVNTNTELKKILFRYPILEEFHKDDKRIEGSILSSFYATSKVQVDGGDFYAQLSFAFHNDQYYIGTILRDRFEDNEEQWVRHTFFFDKIEEAFPVANSFLKCCGKLGILDSDDLTEYDFLFN